MDPPLCVINSVLQFHKISHYLVKLTLIYLQIIKKVELGKI